MVGLTGGIGAGKSEVANRLAGHGAVVIDADRLAREVVAPGTDGFREVVAEFGDTVVDPTGGLDRAGLARAVFDDEPARRRLEQIIHPRVRARTAELTAAAPAGAVVVNDVPLLVESGLAPSYHLVIVVEAPEATRVARLVQDRRMTEAEARARIRSQASDPDRRAAADVLLTNDSTRADLQAAVDRLWRERLVVFEHNLRTGRPAAADPDAGIVQPDPTWPQQAARLIDRLRRLAGERALRIDHVGPTAVPGLPAEDVIELQLVVESTADAERLAGQLPAAGLVRLSGERPEPGPAGRAYPAVVAGSADPGRAATLHLREHASPAWRQALRHRDRLRAAAEGGQRPPGLPDE